MCRRCRAVLRSLKATIVGLNTLGQAEPAPDPAVADSVIARVRGEHERSAGP
jgi:hypothetical protein